MRVEARSFEARFDSRTSVVALLTYHKQLNVMAIRYLFSIHVNTPKFMIMYAHMVLLS